MVSKKCQKNNKKDPDLNFQSGSKNNQDPSKPATLQQITGLMANLKKDIKSDFDASLEIFKTDQQEIIKQEICKQNKGLERRLEFLEKKERQKNIILRGVPEPSGQDHSEITNIAGIVEYMGIKKLNLEEVIVYARRLGKVPGKRPLKIEFEALRHKRAFVAWREQFSKEGITISNDYTIEERQEYSQNKETVNLLKTKYGITAKLRGKFFIARGERYSRQEILKWIEVEKNNDQELQSSPEEIHDNKRKKMVQAQQTQRKITALFHPSQPKEPERLQNLSSAQQEQIEQ